MRKVRRDIGIEAERLRSADPDAWLSPIERVKIVDLVDQACEAWAVDPLANTPLDRLAPAARFPPRLIDDRDTAIRLVEKLVVSYRRGLAGYAFAVETRRAQFDVAAEFGLGHCAVSDQDDESYWLAARPLT